MTHLSDFSYLQRCAVGIYVLVFLSYRIFQNDRFKCLSPRRVFDGELKSIITILFYLMVSIQLSWDMVSAWIKYNEEFFLNPSTEEIIATPFILWTPTHQHISQAMDYVECVNLSMQTGFFFLLQCFWNYLSNSVAKKTFMGSLEFKLYITWALASVAIFPILQWRFRDDVYMRETVPQFAYSVEILITAILGIRSHRRFVRIINISRNMKNGANAIVEKLAYFKDMNVFLTIVLFLYGVSLCIICIDGFTTAKLINTNKFAADLLIANCNMAVVLMWIICISIFHPRPEDNEKSGSTTQSSDVEHYSPENRGHQYHNEKAEIQNNNPNYYNNVNNSIMRPMSPVAIAYPIEEVGESRVFTPTSQFNYTERHQQPISVVEDPYNRNQTVSFHMVEPTIPSSSGKYYNMPHKLESPSSSHFRF